MGCQLSHLEVEGGSQHLSAPHPTPTLPLRFSSPHLCRVQEVSGDCRSLLTSASACMPY